MKMHTRENPTSRWKNLNIFWDFILYYVGQNGIKFDDRTCFYGLLNTLRQFLERTQLDFKCSEYIILFSWYIWYKFEYIKFFYRYVSLRQGVILWDTIVCYSKRHVIHFDFFSLWCVFCWFGALFSIFYRGEKWCSRSFVLNSI